MFKKYLILITTISLLSNCEENKSVSLVTTALNIRRKSHGPRGIVNGKYHFENDYLKNIKQLLQLGWPIRVYIQRQYLPHIKQYLHKNVDLQILEEKDLRKYKNYTLVQKAKKRVNPLAYNSPSYQTELYSIVILQKIDFLMKLAKENPFKTTHFFWVDSNWHVNHFKKENLNFIIPKHDRLNIHYFNMTGNLKEIHGMNRKKHDKYCGKLNNELARGGIFGGTFNAIKKVHELYHHYLNLTLKALDIGTEENIFTYCYCNSPTLLNWYKSPLLYEKLKK